MAERMTKQMEVAYKELQSKHGVAILARRVASNEYEMIIVETPVGHTSHHHPKVTEPTKLNPLQEYEGNVATRIKGFGRDENAIVHQLVKRIQLAEHV